MSQKPVHVAIAILYRDGKFLLQLRDNIPGIIYPGHWGFFGGHMEPDETPEAAVKRELLEEIGYAPPEMSKFGLYSDSSVVRHVFHGELGVELSQLVLGEGWDMDLLTPEEIRQGERYSEKAGEVRPLGRPHQQILLDFINRMSPL
jgi:8-oxo-dGTP pyrophosphatase MutT (NUDIX family)